ncbi:MAG: entericidin A/B family lipoprotein [Alphaproteobacteria bacterium]|nr:entericidin A/B family lipoprotein [Alphaproteobacteria bacterium]
MRRILCLTTTLIGTALVLSACNTVEGVGKDIQKAGQAIEDAGRK